MRCYMCDGRGMRYDGFQNLYRTCEKCGGSGIAEPLTNEEYIREYIRSCTTEQLAELLTNIQTDGYFKTNCMTYEERLAWLKEKHDEQPQTNDD